MLTRLFGRYRGYCHNYRTNESTYIRLRDVHAAIAWADAMSAQGHYVTVVTRKGVFIDRTSIDWEAM